jgi:hypothetical protein
LAPDFPVHCSSQPLNMTASKKIHISTGCDPKKLAILSKFTG